MDTREGVREYFNKCKLSYSNIGLNEIYKLIKILNENISKTDSCMIMINTPKKKDMIFKDKDYDYELIFATLTVKGTYFEDREAITFNRDGFIGFCGWADEKNSKLFLDGFKEWCDWLRSELLEDR